MGHADAVRDLGLGLEESPTATVLRLPARVGCATTGSSRVRRGHHLAVLGGCLVHGPERDRGKDHPRRCLFDVRDGLAPHTSSTPATVSPWREGHDHPGTDRRSSRIGPPARSRSAGPRYVRFERARRRSPSSRRPEKDGDRVRPDSRVAGPGRSIPQRSDRRPSAAGRWRRVAMLGEPKAWTRPVCSFSRLMPAVSHPRPDAGAPLHREPLGARPTDLGRADPNRFRPEVVDVSDGALGLQAELRTFESRAHVVSRAWVTSSARRRLRRSLRGDGRARRLGDGTDRSVHGKLGGQFRARRGLRSPDLAALHVHVPPLRPVPPGHEHVLPGYGRTARRAILRARRLRRAYLCRASGARSPACGSTRR